MASETLNELADDFQQAAQRFRSPRVLIEALKMVAIADLQEGMQHSVSPDDIPHPPLAIPRAINYTGPPLLGSGRLMNSLRSGQNHVETVSDEGFTIGTNRRGAALMQFGGTVQPKGHPFLAIPRTPEAAAFSSPRNFPRPLVPIFGAKGGVLIDKVGKGKAKRSAGRVQYALVPSVRVPARPFVGVGQRMLGKLGLVCEEFASRAFGVEG